MNEVTTSKLVDDLRTLTKDLGAFVKTTRAAIAELRQPIEAKIAAGRKALAERRAMRSSDTAVANETAQSRAFDAAWVAVAMATCVGVALGLLLRRHD